jgi:hypothetical protein
MIIIIIHMRMPVQRSCLTHVTVCVCVCVCERLCVCVCVYGCVCMGVCEGEGV